MLATVKVPNCVVITVLFLRPYLTKFISGVAYLDDPCVVLVSVLNCVL